MPKGTLVIHPRLDGRLCLAVVVNLPDLGGECLLVKEPPAKCALDPNGRLILQAEIQWPEGVG